MRLTSVVLERIEGVDEPRGPMHAMVLGHGREVGTPQRVTFAVDRRSAMDLQHSLATGGQVVVVIEPWQIIGGHN
jgi:hypothetical protein